MTALQVLVEQLMRLSTTAKTLILDTSSLRLVKAKVMTHRRVQMLATSKRLTIRTTRTRTVLTSHARSLMPTFCPKTQFLKVFTVHCIRRRGNHLTLPTLDNIVEMIDTLFQGPIATH